MNDDLVKILREIESKDITFSEAYYKILDAFSISYCADQIADRINHDFVDVAKKNVGKLINEIPEAVEMIITLERLDKYRTK